MSELSGQSGIAGWYSDPYGRAVQRYFNGVAWTAYVIDASGAQLVDDPNQAPQPPQPPSVQAGQGAIVINNVVNSAPRPMRPVLTGGLGMPGFKSPGTAVLLAFLFGPLGVMYVNVWVGLGLLLAVILTSPTIVLPLVLYVGGIFYASSAAKQHNAALFGGMTAPQPIYGVQPAQQWAATQPVPPPSAAPPSPPGPSSPAVPPELSPPSTPT